jgi:hypothetical protein
MRQSQDTSPVTVGRRVGKTRGPVAVWLLSAVTLGIYFLIWWYKINREVRDFAPSIGVSPGVATLAVSVGSLVVVPPIVSIVRTGRRIAAAQQSAGLPPTCSGVVGFLLSLVLGVNVIYYQAVLNQVWAQARGGL